MTNYDSKKLTELVLFILGKTGGVDFYYAFKILYFAEMKHLAKWGNGIVPDEFCALKYGPVPTKLYIGDVYEIIMTEANGIKPKAGDSSRDKYFIVLGFGYNNIAFGGVINSQINKNLPAHLKLYHMPIKQSKYPFLKYDSFVDCVRLKVAYPQKFNEWNLTQFGL